MKHKVLFLDRDGTLNVDRTYVSDIADWEWIPGAREALKTLQDAGFLLAVITNQSGIGHGLYTAEDMQAVHEFMVEDLRKLGITLSFIAFCPHRRDEDCACAKPGTGMADMIEREVGPIDYKASWTIGDKQADVLFGKSLGTHTALIRSRYWQEGELEQKPDYIVPSLSEAVPLIIS